MTSKTQTRTFNTHIDIPEVVRNQMIELLNQNLADAFDLYSQTKQAHWNVKGLQFIALHELFDELAASIEGHIDNLAERATALGGLAMGTARMAAAMSRLPEYPAELTGGIETLETLVDRYAQFGSSIRDAIDISDQAGDMGTSDLFTEVVRDVDKHLWFLEAHLQK